MRRILAAGLAVLAVAAGVPVAAADPPGTVAVSPTSGDSPLRQRVVLLAGSPTHVVYAVAPVQLGGVDWRGRYVEALWGLDHVFIADSEGAATASAFGPAVGAWSTQGDFVISVSSPQGVRWQDLAAGTSGTDPIPIGADVLGATTDGWVLRMGNELFTQTPGGEPAFLADPYFAQSVSVLDAWAGPAGVVVLGTQNHLVYVAYADPSHPIALSVPPDYIANDASLSCIVGDAAAVCVTRWIEFDHFEHGYRTDARIPLDGGELVQLEATEDQVALDDAVTAVSSSSGTTTLIPVDGSASAELPSGRTYTGALVGAFGDIMLTDPTQTQLLRVHDADDQPSVFFQAPLSPIRATSAAVTIGRVVWADDQANPTDPTATTADIWSRDVVASGGSLTVGDPLLVSDVGLPGGIAASGATTVYGDVVDGAPYLHAVGPLRSRVIPLPKWVRGSAFPAVSGHRALISNNRHKHLLIDLNTGEIMRLFRHTTEWRRLVLWGDTLLYTHDDSLWSLNLATGVRREVRRPLHGPPPLFLFGQRVGWSNRWIDLRRPTVVHKLATDQRIVGLTTDGVVSFDSDDGALRLTSYGTAGTSMPLEVPPWSHITIDASVVTWVEDGVAKAAPLPAVANRPRYLGNAVASRRFTHPRTGTWNVDVPFSAALQDCAVRLRRNGVTIRVLACRDGMARYGDAVATWNGRDTDGHVVTAGKVNWVVVASNADGDALGTGGQRVHGTVTVGER